MPSTGVPVVDILVAIAAALTAVGVIWRKAIRPVVGVAKRADDVLPVIMEIATEFKPNDGSSLRDTINKIQKDGADQLLVLSEYTHTFKHDFVSRFVVLEGHQVLLTERLEWLTERVDRLSEEVRRSTQDTVVGVAEVVDSRRQRPGRSTDKEN